MNAAEYRALLAGGDTPKPKKPLKYRNKPFFKDGEHWDSIAEFRRWGDLKLLERAGEIADLVRQPTFHLDFNGVHIGAYRGDFAYRRVKTGERVIEDVKSEITAKDSTYRLKKNLMLAVHGITIAEIMT